MGLFVVRRFSTSAGVLVSELVAAKPTYGVSFSDTFAYT